MLKRIIEIAIVIAAIAAIYTYFSSDSETPTAESAAVEPLIAWEPASVVAEEEVAIPTPPPEPPPPTAGQWTERDQRRLTAIRARFASGAFEMALTMADETLGDPRYTTGLHEWVVGQLPALLTSAGWAKLKLGDCVTATQYLRRAESLRVSRETTKGLAVCYYKMKNHISAAEQFAQYLKIIDNDPQMKLLYADSLESLERYDEAVHLLEETGRGGLTKDEQGVVEARLASMQEKAKESRHQVREHTRNFHLSYRTGEHEDLVAFVLEELESSLDRYVELYGFLAPVAPIEVVLYPADNFTAMVPGGPSWAEGLFDGRLRIPVRESMLGGRRAGLRQVLRHELVHALFAAMNDSRALPSWFDEGIAQLLSCDAEQNCNSFMFPATPGNFLSTTAFTQPYISFDAVKAGQAYRQSLYMIYYLRRQYGYDGISEIIRRISPTAALDSDSLLSPHNMTFADLRDKSAAEWDEREPLTWPQ